jgi:hypothetical protein
MPRKSISEQVTNRRSVLDSYPLTIDISNKKKMETRVKPTDSDKIINFYEVIPKKYLLEAENPNYNVHNIDLPFRMCVVAPSGSGKTNFLVNLIKVFSQGKGTFADIHICTANKDEPLYNWLTKENEQITISEGILSTPKLDSMDKEENHLVIWDDLVLTKDLSSVEKYYIRARKLNCSVVFLSQSYYDIPKMIRKNSSYLVVLNLGGSKRETTALLNEWGTELDKDELKAIYDDCTSEHMRPLIIAGGKVDKNKKYRKGWKDYYNLDKFLKNIPRTLPKKRGVRTDYSSSEPDSD